MIPMKLTMENVRGMEKNWGQSAAEGLWDREAKSGALVISVAILLTQDIKFVIIPHPSSDP
jgi:hypothetical protein